MGQRGKGMDSNAEWRAASDRSFSGELPYVRAMACRVADVKQQQITARIHAREHADAVKFRVRNETKRAKRHKIQRGL